MMIFFSLFRQNIRYIWRVTTKYQADRPFQQDFFLSVLKKKQGARKSLDGKKKFYEVKITSSLLNLMCAVSFAKEIEEFTC